MQRKTRLCNEELIDAEKDWTMQAQTAAMKAGLYSKGIRKASRISPHQDRAGPVRGSSVCVLRAREPRELSPGCSKGEPDNEATEREKRTRLGNAKEDINSDRSGCFTDRVTGEESSCYER